MSKPSPTSRTLELLRADGYSVQVVEKWLPWAKRRQDLFGCIDILAMKQGVLIGIQATSGVNHNARVVKSTGEPLLRVWLTVAKFEVISWSKRGKRGEVKRWEPRREELFLEDLPAL